MKELAIGGVMREVPCPASARDGKFDQRERDRKKSRTSDRNAAAAEQPSRNQRNAKERYTNYPPHKNRDSAYY